MPQPVDVTHPVVKLLTEHGPLSDEDIVQKLEAAGVADPERVLDEFSSAYDAPRGFLPDERTVWLPALLAGKVFTHRVNASEIADDVLAVTPDLEPVAWSGSPNLAASADPLAPRVTHNRDDLIEAGRITYDGGDQFGVLILPVGTLHTLGVSEGDLVGVRATVDGLTVEKVDAVAESNAGALMAAALEPDDPHEVESVTWAACSQDPTLFTEPLAPLSDIIDAAGMTRDEHLVASGEFDFGAWRFDSELRALADEYELSADDALAVSSLLLVHSSLQRALEDPDLDDAGAEFETDDDDTETAEVFTGAYTEFGAKLADPVLAEVLFREATASGRIGAAALGMLADTLPQYVPRAAQANCRWLGAAALERLGDAEEAERELLAIETMDPNCTLALFDLARFASDRGQAERGLSLLRRAGADPDDYLVQLLQGYVAAPRSDIGRNDACWCGSGRKYKKCHLGREEKSLPERSDWLYAKAAQHVLTADWEELLAAVRLIRALPAGHDEELAEKLRSDPLVMDSVLVEGGGFAEFLEQRGVLLPDDERELLEAWVDEERTVFAVDSVDDDVAVIDLRRKVALELGRGSVGAQLRVGQFLCGRALPVGDGLELVGAVIEVQPHHVDELIELLDSEPSPVELAAFFTRPMVPPIV
ncbi:SEC-C domain-containing protein [Mycolicibacterium mucogenicum]|uniref:Zinc-binding protein n=1 Tax=Mycolicibacterium mucogenicum TaxID=56689 RepID=A0A4R5W764_MYCMU|nr:SEC-C domain-containing protein [Mycolicibacterium mucogenicum]TDK84628.1 zinc-binding protein [Mycolicibacterium mucogenicum]